MDLKLELCRAIAEMAYVIAKADHGLSADERKAFNKIVQEELDYQAWSAQSRFELLDEVTQPTIEQAYNDAMNEFKKHKTHLSPALKEKAFRVLTKVAESCRGFSKEEATILDRFKNDLQNI